MELLTYFLVLGAGICILSLSSDRFVEAAQRIGLFLGLPPFLIGVVFLGFGTSLPELASSIVAVFQGQSQIVLSNAIGSNITNIFLVLGVSALFSASYTIKHDIFKADLPFLIASAILISLMTYDGSFTIYEAALCLLALGLYLYHSLQSHREKREEGPLERPHPLNWLTLFLCPPLIALGAQATIRGVLAISELIGIGTEIITLTVVALGTSLPEVLVSVQAARKGHGEIAVGNVLGSNIFNTLGVMGISALFGPLAISETYPYQTLPFFLGATALLYFIVQDRRVFRLEGLLLLLFYLFFLGSSYGFF